MNRYFRNCFVLSFLVAMATSGVARTPSVKTNEPTPNVTVWLYDYARIHRDALAQAKSEVRRIFRQAGVRITWVDCPCSGDESHKYPDCGGVLGPTQLVLRILPRSLPSRANGHSTVFGQAALPDDGGFGLQAGVYAYGAEELSREQNSPSAVILGHLTAHELGHLLIGTATHSSVGIMRGEWSVLDLKRAVQGRLLFSTKDAKRIRAQVRARMQAEHFATGNAARAGAQDSCETLPPPGRQPL
jgi:hypothetical protein